MNVLAESIEYLWYSVWGMIAGWGLTTTFFAIVVGTLVFKVIRMERRIETLEARLVHAERDYNLTLSKWLKK